MRVPDEYLDNYPNVEHTESYDALFLDLRDERMLLRWALDALEGRYEGSPAHLIERIRGELEGWE